MNGSRSPLLVCLALSCLGGSVHANIQSYTLDEMEAVADGVIHGWILGSRVVRVDGADGSAAYFTTLTIQGRLLGRDRTATVEVAYRGGALGEDEGVYCSEAPAADEVRVGRQVVAFYRWTQDMGGGFAANALVAAHGGLYAVVEGPDGAIVLGRGRGYAVHRNVRAASLDAALREIAESRRSRR